MVLEVDKRLILLLLLFLLMVFSQLHSLLCFIVVHYVVELLVCDCSTSIGKRKYS